MKFIYATYNMYYNSIDINTYAGYILRIDCNKAEEGLRTTGCSQCALNALAIDEPLEYARLALERPSQSPCHIFSFIRSCKSAGSLIFPSGRISCNNFLLIHNGFHIQDGIPFWYLYLPSRRIFHICRCTYPHLRSIFYHRIYTRCCLRSIRMQHGRPAILFLRSQLHNAPKTDYILALVKLQIHPDPFAIIAIL